MEPQGTQKNPKEPQGTPKNPTGNYIFAALWKLILSAPNLIHFVVERFDRKHCRIILWNTSRYN